ncbi:MAG: hypothetical protein K6E95_04185 [Lachnospiraceae bacterium]|nr:hypothetical protein [Lachnospiraceae bacterium]
MKRLTKILAVALAFVLAFGSVPASADSDELSLTKTKKTIFVDGCRGTTEAGKVAKYYSYSGIQKIVKNFDKSTMDIKLESSDSSIASTDDKKDRVNAVAVGKAAVTVNVFNKKTSELLFSKPITVTVKKNATQDTLIVSGIKDGDTFKVDDSVTVKLTRKSGTDTDLRRLVSDGDGVTIEEAGTRKYKVTFTKAGTFTLNAESYQSSKYSGTTAYKSISVTVEEGKTEEEKKAEEEQKKAEEEKKKAEEEKKAQEAKLSASQISATQFKVSGTAITSDYKKEIVKIDKVVFQDQRTSYSGMVKEVSVTDNTAIVTMFSSIENGFEYVVTVGSEEARFTSVKLESDPLKSIKAMALKTHTATVNEDTTLEFIYYDAAGVDITGYVKNQADTLVQVVDLNQNTTNFATVYGQTVSFYEKGKVLSVKATLTTGYDDVTFKPIEITATGNIMGVEKQLPTVRAVHYTISNDGDTVYYKVGDKENKRICVGDYGYSLEMLYEFTDGTYKTPTELGAELRSESPTVLMFGGTSASGGMTLLPNTAGDTYIKVKVGDQTMQGIKISVSGERKASRIVSKIEDGKSRLNIDPLVGDEIVITANVYDQYGDVMKNASIYAQQTEPSQKNVSASIGAFVNGELTINGSDCAIIGTASEYPVNLILTDGTLKSDSINFMVKSIPFDTSKMASYNAETFIDGSANIDTGLVVGKQEDDNTRVYIRFTSDGYTVGQTVGELFTEPPKSSMKAADKSKAAGSVIAGMTIQYIPEGGQATYITSGTNISATGFWLEFDPVSTGAKLAKGRYVINSYIITLGENSSVIKPLTTKQVVVVDNALVGRFVQKKETANVSGAIEQIVGEFFDFYLEGTKLDPANITSVSSNTNIDGKSTYVTSVTFTLSNDPYGSFPITITVNRLIRFSA